MSLTPVHSLSSGLPDTPPAPTLNGLLSIKTNNKDNTDIANITLEQCLTQYNSIIDNPEKHSDIHYLINLFLLLQNDVSCFNISNSFVNVKENDKIMTGGMMDEQRENDKIMTGGMDEQRNRRFPLQRIPFPLQRDDPDPQPYDQVFEINDHEEEIIQLGPGNNLLVYLIPSTVVFVGLLALSNLFGMPVGDPMFISGLIAASIIITTNGGIRMLNLIGNGANDNLISYVQGNRLIDTGIWGLRRIVNITLIQPNIERLVGNGIIRPMALLNPNIRLQRLIINSDQFNDDLRQRVRLLAIRDGHVADAISAGDNQQLNDIDAGRNEELVAHAAGEQAVRDNLRQQVADAEQQGNEELVAYAAGIQAGMDNLQQQLADARQQRIEEYARPVFKLQSQANIQDFLKTKQTELGILIPHFSEKQPKTQLQQFKPLPSGNTLFDKLKGQWKQYIMGWKEPPPNWGNGDDTEKRNRKKGELNGIPLFSDTVNFTEIYKEQLKDVQNSYLAILTEKMDNESAKRFMWQKLNTALETIFNKLRAAPTEVVQRYNELQCPRCSEPFQFNEELGYICNLSRVGASEPQQLMDKLNVFPSIDLIESITPQAVANNIGYQFNNNFGEYGEDGKVYGEYLTCSQCAITNWEGYDQSNRSIPIPLTFPRTNALPKHMPDIQVKDEKMMLDIWNRVYSTEILNLIEQDDIEQLKPTYDRIRKLCINSLYKYKTTEQRNIIMNEFVDYYTTEGGWNELNQTQITRVGLEAQANGNNKEQAEETERAILNALPEEEKKDSIYSYFLKEEETFQRGPNDYKNDNDDKIKYMTISCPTCIEAVIGPLTNSFYELRKANRMDNLRCHCNACQTDFNGYTGSEIKDLPEPVEREIMIAIGSGKNNIYPTFVDAFRRYDLEIQQAQGRLFSIPGATLRSILLAREWKRLGDAEQEMLILKGQNKQCPNPICKTMAIHENGCSQMSCGRKENGTQVTGCGTEWCYICGEATRGTILYGDTQHDTTHFLMNLEPPFGSYYALQCCNVNWTIKDINGQPGNDDGYKQIVSFSSQTERDARQNPIVP